MSGPERWARAGSADYQSDDDIRLSRRGAETDRKRMEEARRIVAEGPLSLETCLALSLELNDAVQGVRAAIRAEAAGATVARSRLLPQLSYSLTNQVVSGDGTNTEFALDHYLRLGQTIAEFGRENPANVAVREAGRAALFRYEETVRSVLSEIRKRFFTVLLRQEQIAERGKLLAEFRGRYEEMRKLEAVRRVLEVDVLTARLNVLNEEARLNSLEREMLRQKIDLLRLVGLPAEMTGINLGGELEEFTLALEDSVAVGLRRSTLIAQARADVVERRRAVREVAWRYGPEALLRAGAKSDTGAAGVELRSSEGVYALSAFGEQHLQESVDSFNTGYDALDPLGAGWSADVQLRIPVSDGLRRRGERAREEARLVQALHALRDAADSVETEIRKAYLTMIERRKELEILKETVYISKERLRVQERLKELGKITDNELETFRNRFFSDQDAFFGRQIALMEAQEDLRRAMRFFEPPADKPAVEGAPPVGGPAPTER